MNLYNVADKCLRLRQYKLPPQPTTYKISSGSKLVEEQRWHQIADLTVWVIGKMRIFPGFGSVLNDNFTLNLLQNEAWTYSRQEDADNLFLFFIETIDTKHDDMACCRSKYP